MTRNIAVGLAVAAALLMVSPALAGCVGGGGQGSSSPTPDASQTGSDDDTEAQANESVQRAHVHDRWRDPARGESVTEIVVAEGEHEIEPVDPSRPVPLQGCERQRQATEARTCLGWTELRPGEWAGGEPKVVPPGTDQLTATLTFSADDFAGIDLYFQHADSQGLWTRLTNASNGGPYAPGGDTRSIDVTLKMSDDGHAQVSRWAFGLAPWGDPVSDGATGLLDVGSGAVEVRIVAHRVEGQLPLEPAHPEFWSDGTPATDTYRIGSLEGATSQLIQAGRLTWEPQETGSPKLSGDGVVWRIPPGFHGQRMSDTATPTRLEGRYTDALVPPGTEMIAVTLEVGNASVSAGDAEVCVLGVDIPGEGFPGGDRRSEAVIGECQPFDDGEVTLTQAITDRETDSYYVNRSSGLSHSRWTFYVQVAAETVAGQPGPAVLEGDLQADVYVTRATQFSPPTEGA